MGAYTLAIYVIVIMVMLTSCSHQEAIEQGEIEPYKVTLYYPDGTTETFEAKSVSIGDGIRNYFTKMDGTEYMTTVRMVVEYPKENQ